MPIVREVKYARKNDHNLWIGPLMTDHWGHIVRKKSALCVPYDLRVLNYKDDAQINAMLKNYAKWLYKQMQSSDPKQSEPVWTALRQIHEGSVLLCHCELSKRCHGHVVIRAWQWARQQGLLDTVTTPHSSDKTLKLVARANGKALAPVVSNGPRDEADILKALASAKLDEEILESCPHDHEICQPRTDLLMQTLPPKKKQGIGALRKRRSIQYITTDVRYNRLDEIAADLEELYTTREYIRDTRAVA
jgi:6-pyruvoyl-tetrahydropterin synthase